MVHQCSSSRPFPSQSPSVDIRHSVCQSVQTSSFITPPRLWPGQRVIPHVPFSPVGGRTSLWPAWWGEARRSPELRECKAEECYRVCLVVTIGEGSSLPCWVPGDPIAVCSKPCGPFRAGKQRCRAAITGDHRAVVRSCEMKIEFDNRMIDLPGYLTHRTPHSPFAKLPSTTLPPCTPCTSLASSTPCDPNPKLINRRAARLASSRLSTASIPSHFTRPASSRAFGRAASASEHKTTDPPGRAERAEWNVWARGSARAEYRDDRDRDRQEVEQNFRGVVDGLVSSASSRQLDSDGHAGSKKEREGERRRELTHQAPAGLAELVANSCPIVGLSTRRGKSTLFGHQSAETNLTPSPAAVGNGEASRVECSKTGLTTCESRHGGVDNRNKDAIDVLLFTST